MLQQKIVAIAQTLVQCPLQCPDTLNAPTQGVLPRCLFLEDATGQVSADPEFSAAFGGLGAVAVGLNPGRSSPTERTFYQASIPPSYNSLVQWYLQKGSQNAYYSKLRKFIRDLGRTEILWTELAKCENQPKGLNPGVPTLRHCTGLYLRRELAAVDDSWLLFGIGQEAWRALAYLYPDRAVIGIPHPTGSFGHFTSIVNNYGCLLPGHQAAVQTAIQNKEALWLR